MEIQHFELKYNKLQRDESISKQKCRHQTTTKQICLKVKQTSVTTTTLDIKASIKNTCSKNKIVSFTLISDQLSAIKLTLVKLIIVGVFHYLYNVVHVFLC